MMKEGSQTPIIATGTDKVDSTPVTLNKLSLRVSHQLNLSPLYLGVYEAAHEDSYVSVEKLSSLNWVPVYSNPRALIDAFEWYLENYPENNETTGQDQRVAWDLGRLN